MDMSPAEIWWKYVPSSRLMVKTTEREITENGISLQIAPNFFPWKEQFENDLRECIERYGAGIVLRDLHGSELNQYTRLLDGIVHTLGVDYGFDGSLQSIGNNLPSEGCVVWLHKLTEVQQKQCMELCAKAAEISGKGDFPRFVMIFESDISGKHKCVKKIEKGNVSRSNIRYFVYRMLMEDDLDKMTEYAVSLVMEQANGEIELCGDICDRIRCNGFEKEYHAVEENANMLFAVHRAQIRSIEPLIQLGRLQLCQKYREKIQQKLLPFRDDYNTEISNPYELELRHLMHYRADIGFSGSDLKLLQKLYDARNDISHQRILPFSVLQSLVEMYS